jgi:CRISPR-associated endonuclease Csn1
LHQRFNTEKKRKTQIITLKSLLTSQFRKNFKLYKVREINDYHHAHDAYLNGVIANKLLKVYPKLRPEFVYGEYKKVDFRSDEKATEKKYFYSNIMKFFAEEKKISDENGEVVWDKEKSIARIKKVLEYRQMNIVKKTEIQTGAFSNETIKPKGPSAKLISRKNGWDPVKYGGFDSPIVAYSVAIMHKKKEKINKAIVGITVMEQEAFEKNSIKFLEQKGFIQPEVLLKLPKYTLYELENGRRRMLASASEAQKGNQLCLPRSLAGLLYHAKNYEKSAESLEYIEKNRESFSELLDHVRVFAENYTLVPKNLKLILETYEKNKQADIKDTARSFIALMQLNMMGAPSDFNFFGVTIPRSRYKGVKELLEGVIIQQSITGLYETRNRFVE